MTPASIRQSMHQIFANENIFEIKMIANQIFLKTKMQTSNISVWKREFLLFSWYFLLNQTLNVKYIDCTT